MTFSVILFCSFSASFSFLMSSTEWEILEFIYKDTRSENEKLMAKLKPQGILIHLMFFKFHTHRNL